MPWLTALPVAFSMALVLSSEVPWCCSVDQCILLSRCCGFLILSSASACLYDLQELLFKVAFGLKQSDVSLQLLCQLLAFLDRIRAASPTATTATACCSCCCFAAASAAARRLPPLFCIYCTLTATSTSTTFIGVNTKFSTV